MNNNSTGQDDVQSDNLNESYATDDGPPTAQIYGRFGFIFVVGVVGNMLVILAVSRRLQGMHKTMIVFITNLSISDMLFLIFFMPFSATILTMPSWLFGNFMCKFVNFFMYTSMFSSIYTLVAMSLDRYIAIVYPLGFFDVRTLRNSVALAIIIWIVSCIFSSPYLYVFGTEIENYTVNYTTYTETEHYTVNYYTETYCVENWQHKRQRPRYHVFLFISGYAVPLIAISGAYLRILCVLWRKMELTEGAGQSSAARAAKSKMKTLRLVIVVVLAFGICWLPHHIINLWMGFGKFEFTMGTMIFKIFALCLASFNSCLNPILYTISSENFRNSLVKSYSIYILEKTKK
ncbi:galanin receptor type 1-like [Amphiura filiformis]|uniref:galanin receptor type 1-like n=1 Tax=Amphiura filiformis TaxID=82378 RepID=UPI003B20F05D